MPPSKYERELRFIDTEVSRLNRALQSLIDKIPSSPAEAAEKADEIIHYKDKIEQLNNRRKEIEESFIRAGLDLPNIARSMNATVHNAGAFEVHSPGEPMGGVVEMGEIQSIGKEISAIEEKIVEAEIAGDVDEKIKLEMMVSSLKERRSSIIERMKSSRQTPEEPSESNDKRIEELEADVRGLRSQLSEVRNSNQDIKDQLRRILEALNIDED